MSAATTSPVIASTAALARAIAAAEHFRQTGQLPAWASTPEAKRAATRTAPL